MVIELVLHRGEHIETRWRVLDQELPGNPDCILYYKK
jgi:hypothetical protein